MTRVEEIKHEIEKLTEDEFAQLREWFIEMEWKKWDKQIEEDSKKGKLDFLIEEARKEKAKGKLKAL